MQRKMFGFKREEATGDMRKLHKQQLHDPYSSPNIIRAINSRMSRWAGHVACLGENTNRA
jgi:hypothetical protein